MAPVNPEYPSCTWYMTSVHPSSVMHWKMVRNEEKMLSNLVKPQLRSSMKVPLFITRSFLNRALPNSSKFEPHVCHDGHWCVPHRPASQTRVSLGTMGHTQSREVLHGLLSLFQASLDTGSGVLALNVSAHHGNAALSLMRVLTYAMPSASSCAYESIMAKWYSTWSGDSATGSSVKRQRKCSWPGHICTPRMPKMKKTKASSATTLSSSGMDLSSDSTWMRMRGTVVRPRRGRSTRRARSTPTLGTPGRKLRMPPTTTVKSITFHPSRR
mmetsp:Transcript_27438/g.88189  ORF Transcript_27438/g.88189 Transcript_27438/m.88189 type:complete len:270 (+) Transcript_27438:470-1279(+)